MAKSNSARQETDRSAKLRAELEAAGCADACLSLSALPCPAFASNTSALGNGLGWCPHGLPNGNSIHLASSRLSQQLESFPAWFDAIRTFGSNVDGDATFLLTAETDDDRPMGGCDWVKLFDIPVVQIARFPKQVTAKWIEQQKSKIIGAASHDLG